MPMLRYILSFSVLLVSFSVVAEEIKQQYTLETLVKQALSRSDLILSLQASIEEKQAAAAQAGAWQNPVLNINGGVKSALPSPGPMFQAGLSQLVFFPGKQKLRREVAGFDKEIKSISLAESELNITTDVIRLAYEYAMYERKLKFAESRRKRFLLIQSYLAGHMFASPQQMTTCLIVKERLRNINADWLRLQGEVKSRFEQLNFYIAVDPQSNPAITVPWLNGTRALSDEVWISKTQADNLDLASQKVQIDKATKEQQLLKREVWPDISISAFYGQETAGETQRMAGIGLGISLPLWNQNQAGIHSAALKIKAEKYQLSLQVKQNEAHIRKLLAQYEASRNIVKQYPQDSIATLAENLQIMEKEFRKNRVDFLLFLELDMQAAETVNHILEAQLALTESILAIFFIAREQTLLSQLSTF